MEAIQPLSKKYSAIDVAYCLIKLADEIELGTDPETGDPIREGITNLKLQKMLYFADATYLALADKPLFEDEIQAWDLGPVVVSAYNEFKKHRSDAIHFDGSHNCDSELINFLREVWKIFGKYSASELVKMSHEHEPYLKHFKKGERGSVIPPDEIRAFYKTLFKVNENKQQV